MMRTPFGRYPEYHTSGDDLGLIRPESLEDSLRKCEAAIRIVDADRRYVNINPNCEPQLGKRGLYDAIGGDSDRKEAQMALLWVLNGSDGSAGLLDIATRAGMPFEAIERAAARLAEHGLLAAV